MAVLQGQECKMGRCCRKVTDGAGTGILEVVCCGNATDGAGTRILEVLQRQD